ncbi:hypothetical protein A3A14_01070 [Candidatus Daviesbacteria bacterium RIFCSPLOWO2_01_FULL_43_38]|uniref:Ferredoxin n=1 Tax=Candidatus Daviesbacteria bacterium RIFCSPHIGHO2_12_FULL_43_11 TaxID=1797780 RepID=A0A1F5K773_9BACT|nr:MAG: hypothetical protein A3E45_01150 [Candidatus Daviesbacteria bacterium RIFCSPHIGHO2_12_FULL_43_11]OGE63556.1 MAG: hypothetical protein A3A14_01070 [Candidatus Daviesbacteria bacterium RIFCSPLOWO2_01_FULL_43_38]
MAKPSEVVYKSGKLTIKINRKTCISCSACTVSAPKTFELDNKCISMVKPEPNDNPKTILDAAQNCPVEAIVIEDETGKTLWPK